MLYRILADSVVLLHVAFVLFVILGGVLTWRWRWMPWLHLPAFLWGIWIEWSGSICPLTPLENRLRAAGGAAGGGGYEGGFIEHYLLPILYPAALTRESQWVLGLLLVMFNLIVYALIWRRYRRGRAPRP